MISMSAGSVNSFSIIKFNSKSLKAKSFLTFLFVLLSACQPKKIMIESDVEIQQWRSDKQIFSLNQSLNDLKHVWKYQAKVGLKTNKGNEQANLIWEYAKQNNKLRLFGPLGMGSVKLNFDQYGAQLFDNKGNSHQGVNASELLNDIVGWPLPVDALTQWLFLLPDLDYAYQYKLNADGKLASIRQLGWQIDYQDYREYNGQQMPRKIIANKEFIDSGLGEVAVRLIAKSWQLGIDIRD